ncbi:hypothetical protein [Desulfopila aestuarii]|uniref:Uncharacterized protein n=1 Tax=Desulfopila aestuarii DSM 18488 TaxID=1121416 RepID=A0A1M7YMQ8_9BACT|nr:hypothetical protein [Desulfopila aestuarii]SHO53875.1 hypothetical protein SAMN02745220_05348 [Desulfopila aestuarii DSM 18488]
MNLEEHSEPPKIPKILVHKIHGGRKQDSKFWQSEFSDSKENLDDIGRHDRIKIDNKDARSIRRGKTVNPIWSVVWRFLLFCLVIDGGIYYYFHVIEKTTVAEGIKALQNSIHGREKVIPHQQIQPRKIPSTQIVPPNETKSSGPDYRYSGQAVNQAKQRLLENKFQSQLPKNQYSTSVQSHPKSVPTTPPSVSSTSKSAKPQKSIYEIKLLTDRVILSEHVMVTSDKVTYEDPGGQIVSINKYEVKTLKRLKVSE